MSDNEYEEWEELRQEVSDIKDHCSNGSLFYRFFSWCLRKIEGYQKEIINERFNR